MLIEGNDFYGISCALRAIGKALNELRGISMRSSAALNNQDFSILFSLCTYETLIKGKQGLVDLKDVIIPMLHEILHDDVKLVGV